MKRIYMDVCCWNRPFDDQTQTRIHLEAEAVLAVITQVEQGEHQLLHSEVIDLEIDDTPDSERRQRLRLLIPRQRQPAPFGAKVTTRAVELEALGFAGVDALHLACAEAGGADVFLTTDDRLLRTAVHQAHLLHVRVANPLAWVQDVRGDET